MPCLRRRLEQRLSLSAGSLEKPGMSTAMMVEPGIVCCQFDNAFQPHLLAMELDWRDSDWATTSRTWVLFEGLQFIGPAPRRFGMELLRHGVDAFSLRMLWNNTRLAWPDLKRGQITHTSLGELLAAMGTDLNYLLDQPIIPLESARPLLKAG
jgi:hypothetical protein